MKREKAEEIRKDEEKQRRIKEEKEIALKQMEEKEIRIKEENRRLKEWEDKFDQDQKIKEEELLKKFHSNHAKNNNIIEEVIDSSANDANTSDNEVNKKN